MVQAPPSAIGATNVRKEQPRRVPSGGIMVIIDAQVHRWGADAPQRQWPLDGAAHAHRAVPMGKEALLREAYAAGLDRVVIVPPSREGERNDPALEAANLCTDRSAVMGRLPVETPESRGLIGGRRRQPGMLGPAPLFHGTISVPQPPPAHPPRGRCLRTPPCVPGDRPDTPALPIPPGGDALHRRVGFPPPV